MNQIDENSDALRQLGNNYLKDKQYLKAVDKYTKALNYTDDTNLILANRAEAYIKAGYFNMALIDCDQVLKNPCSTQLKDKVLYRKARALEQLYNNKDDLLKVKDIYAQISTEINMDNLNEKIRNSEGLYNKDKLIAYEKECLSLINNKKYYLDSLDKEYKFTSYLNNKIELSFDNEKGVFWKAKDNIKEGELIMAEIPLVSVYVSEYKRFASTFNEFEKYGMNSNDIILEILFTFIKDKMKNEPEKNYLINYLSKLSTIDTAKNTFEQRQSKYTNSDNQIKEIISNNSIQTIRSEKGLLEPIELVNGLYYNASFFNHSCCPNCFYFGIANLLFIKATKNIIKDEELTISYIDIKPMHIRKHELKKWEFTCKCKLCQYEIDECESDIYFDGVKTYSVIQNIMKNEEILNLNAVKDRLSIYSQDSMIVTINNFFDKYIKGESIQDIISNKLKVVFYSIFKGFAVIFGVLDKYKEDANYLFDEAFKLIKKISIRERYDILNIWLYCCKDIIYIIKKKELESILLKDYKILFDLN